MKKEVSCKLVKPIILYLKENFSKDKVELFLKLLNKKYKTNFSLDYLLNEQNWISCDFFADALKIGKNISREEDFIKKIAFLLPKKENDSLMEIYLKSKRINRLISFFINPLTIYKLYPYIIKRFTRVQNLIVTFPSSTQAIIRYIFKKGYEDYGNYLVCRFNLFALTTTPLLFKLPPAISFKKTCKLSLKEISKEFGLDYREESTFVFLNNVLVGRKRKAEFLINNSLFKKEIIEIIKNFRKGDLVLEKGQLYGAPYCEYHVKWKAKLGFDWKWTCFAFGLALIHIFLYWYLNILTYINFLSAAFLIVIGFFISLSQTNAKKAKEAIELLREQDKALKESYEKLEQSYLELENKVKEKTLQLKKFYEKQSKFIADLSHELQSPLAIIKGYIETSFQEKDIRELKKTLVVLKEATDRLSLIISNLLTLIKGDFLEYRLEKMSLSLKLLLEEIFEETKILAEDKNIDYRLIQSKEINIKGDKRRLKEMILNLISNAIKYTPPEGKIELKTVLGKKKVYIIVADSGCGISKEELPFIFKRFYRAKDDKTKGTGLGLAISNSIAKAHGGRIEVESRKGKGSKFTVILPL